MLFSVKGRKTYYDVVGPEGDKVVCFAHALLADGGMWAEQLPPLVEAGWRVLRVDLRGHGGSESAGEDCTVNDLAQDVIDLLDHLEIPKAHFVGLSIGGVIGQAIAVKHGHRLNSLVLSDTNPASAPNAKEMWATRVATVRQAKSVAPLAEPTMPRLLTADFKARSRVRWNQIHQTICLTAPEGVYACATALQNFDFTKALPSIQIPAMVMCGQNDPATPPSEARKIVDLIPNARYEEIPNALHFPNVEQPDRFNRLLIDWFN